MVIILISRRVKFMKVNILETCDIWLIYWALIVVLIKCLWHINDVLADVVFDEVALWTDVGFNQIRILLPFKIERVYRRLLFLGFMWGVYIVICLFQTVGRLRRQIWSVQLFLGLYYLWLLYYLETYWTFIDDFLWTLRNTKFCLFNIVGVQLRHHIKIFVGQLRDQVFSLLL